MDLTRYNKKTKTDMVEEKWKDKNNDPTKYKEIHQQILKKIKEAKEMYFLTKTDNVSIIHDKDNNYINENGQRLNR